MAKVAALIRGLGDYYAPVLETPPDLGPVVKEALGAPVRRIGRFVQLGLIGAARAAGGARPPPETSVYLTSGRGDMEVTIDVMTQLYRDGSAPRPLSFINTVSNSACFYIAKHFGLQGRSAFVCNRSFSFETALWLAFQDFEDGAASSALTGSVDIALAPLDVHRKRLRLDPSKPVAEGAHWLWLECCDPNADGPRIAAIEILADASALLGWLADEVETPEQTAIAVGQFADAETVGGIARKAGLGAEFVYRRDRAYYDTQSGAAAAAFLGARPAGMSALVHVNADPDGRFAAFLLKL